MSKIALHPAANSIAPDAVLENAKGTYDKFIMIGWGKDGLLHHHTGGGMTFNEIFYVIESWKVRTVMDQCEEE